MDERLQKALEFSNYNLTFTNQKQNIRNRVNQLKLVHTNGGSFSSEPSLISFVKTLLDIGKTEAVIIDSKDNPVEIKNLQGFFDDLISAYTSATNEYDVEYNKLKKMRSIKKIMDW
ncbi:MAG: hypothetical protein CBE00_13300 [Planctomycetaceae bacterium TMED240]|jgi:hypothetical protein|nr:MAG: hypothetical protein CBE00_13300 [Planctomycetaceae bacterium TMED240]